MTLCEEREPQYKDITKSIKEVAYNLEMAYPSWFCTKRVPIERLMQWKCSYKLRNGEEVKGYFRAVKSCVTAPRVLLELLKGGDGETVCLEGILFGSPSNLGVALKNIKSIE